MALNYLEAVVGHGGLMEFVSMALNYLEAVVGHGGG